MGDEYTIDQFSALSRRTHKHLWECFKYSDASS
jgi:hypothetical protein